MPRSRLVLTAALSFGLAFGSLPSPARAGSITIPPQLLGLLLQLGYLAPLTGVTLTSAQQSQIETIEATGWTSLIPQLVAVVTAHEQIIGELAKPTVNLNAIALLEKKKAAALGVIEKQRITMAAAVQALLTPAQITQEAATHKQQVAALEAWAKAHGL